MHWGNNTQKQMYVNFFLEQYAFLKNPAPKCPYLPVSLDVDISNRCNLRCISCFHSSDRFKAKKDMTLDTFNRVLDQAEGKACIVTIGNHGEPFLHKNIFEMLEAVKRRGFFLNLINNGTLLNKSNAERLLDIGVDRLSFSVDTVDPRYYGTIRRNAKIDITLKNILYFLKINYEAGLPIYVNISTVNTKQALNSKPTVFEYFSQLPVHVIYTSNILNFHNVLPINEQTLWEKKYKDIQDKDKIPVCLNGFDRLFFRPNGDVSLCAIDWECNHILGNVSESPYYELWNNDKAQEFRDALITRDYSKIDPHKKFCSVCDAKWANSIDIQKNKLVKMIADDLKDIKYELDNCINNESRYNFLTHEFKKYSS